MRTPGPVARAVLEILDEPDQALAIPLGLLRQWLAQKKELTPEKTSLLHVLARLKKNGTIAKVPTRDGGFLYTMPKNLKIPGFASVIHDTPVRSRHIRQRAGVSEERLEHRDRKLVRKWGDEGVRRGSHDHRDINRPCPRCDFWPPPPPEKIAKLIQQAEASWTRKGRRPA